MQFYLMPDTGVQGVVQGEHDFVLVAISWLVALAASYAGLDVIKLVRKGTKAAWRIAWLLAGAIAMGLGVWSMHFIGMHAYRLNFPVGHAPLITLLSIIPAVLGSLVALTVMANDKYSHRALCVAGTTLGVGIGIMHYSGMAAMQMSAQLYYSPSLFVSSLFVAISLGIFSVYAYRFCQHEWGVQHAKMCAFIAAFCVSTAICGMHYVAMQAAWFLPLPQMPTPTVVLSHWLIYLISSIALLIALFSIVATRVQRRLQESEHHGYMTQTRLIEVISALQDCVVLLDDQARIRMCNAAFEKMMGMNQRQLSGMRITSLNFAENKESLSHRVRQVLKQKGKWNGKMTALDAQGNSFPAWLSVTRVEYADSDNNDYVALISDRSKEAKAQERIRHLAFHDMLTGLPNRSALHEQLMALASKQSVRDHFAFIALFDVDRFKMLNDTMGQDIGDELLRQLGCRLKQWSEAGRLTARLDGNEFAYVGILNSWSHVDAELEATPLVEQVIKSLATGYFLNGHSYSCKLNVGIYVFPISPSLQIQQLFKRAGLALLNAKNQRNNSPVLFHISQEEELEEHISLERDLKHALEHNQLSLYLQPQVNAYRQVVGAEALLRWFHPERGMISPGYFIPIAEKSGLILPLGQWVLNEGCRLLGIWRHDPLLKNIKLSLNISIRQFQQADFVDNVQLLMAHYDVPAEQLTLELTESLLLKDPQGAIEKMQQLQSLGVQFALDDFGTGYSSLAYLNMLPLNTLKIDIAFVKDLVLDMPSTPIAATIVTLAESLGLNVIAEGVETEEQLSVLGLLGCKMYQGYLFGRPVHTVSFRKMVQNDRSGKLRYVADLGGKRN